MNSLSLYKNRHHVAQSVEAKWFFEQQNVGITKVVSFGDVQSIQSAEGF